jgi:hypothetical protein
MVELLVQLKRRFTNFSFYELLHGGVCGAVPNTPIISGGVVFAVAIILPIMGVFGNASLHVFSAPLYIF